MARRQLRKLYGNNGRSLGLAHSSDDDNEPHCSYSMRTTRTYAGLEIQSSESEDYEAKEASSESETETENVARGAVKKKTKRVMAENIDQLVREVDAVLGKQKPNEPKDIKPNNQPKENYKTFSVRKIHLNAVNEMNKILVDEYNNKRRKHPRQVLSDAISPLSNYPFKRMGLSMSIYEVQGGFTYFSFNHNNIYQAQHAQLILFSINGGTPYEYPTHNAIANFHVEGMLEAFRQACLSQEYPIANKILEKIIAYQQFVAHPSFNVAHASTRLEYKILENRAFHISVLLYSYILSNKSCHRTALELAKMLLNLDPSDPLAVVLIIDTFAIRARKFEWLIEAVDFMESSRNLKQLQNIKYSYALAHFHVSKKPEDLKRADNLLKEALMAYPSALLEILSMQQNAMPNNSKIYNHYFFTYYASESIKYPLSDLIVIYAKLTGARWMEPDVLRWLLRNANELIDIVDMNPNVKEEVLFMERSRRFYFKTYPPQVLRHLIIIKPISNLVADGAVPTIDHFNISDAYNPLSYGLECINRYNYPERFTQNYNFQ